MEVPLKGLHSWLFLVLLAISVSTLRVDGQLDSNGFINIDCGRAPNTSFYNSYTKSTYLSDDQFIDTGENHKIDSKYVKQGLFEELLTVRSFPTGRRNCYTLRSITIGTKYLLRGIFMYGNYDKLNKPPTFDVHLGVNFWETMVITTADTAFFTEIIATAGSDFLQVCLVNKKLGTPFISELHLSELKPTMYPVVNSIQSFVYYDRKNMGASDYLRCGEYKSNKSPVIIIAVVVGAVVLLLIVAIIAVLACLRRTKFSTAPEANNPQGNDPVQNHTNIITPNESGKGILDFQNRQYNYSDLEKITNKFQNHIGIGGFGSVYAGVLQDGTQVAVKVRSSSSSQGVREFQAEAQNLARIHHKNLVPLIGYCNSGDCMALVYQYMKQGTLHDKLIDKESPLSWKQRVRIAHESALGLEYLHRACNPPLIHRDVKTSNILLNENLEAKIADFGLSREFNSSANTHVSTAIVGTPGYLDPEYYTSYRLSEKSDVFSFGVVLLGIITGKPPIIAGSEGSHLKEWVKQKLSRGDIESIVDPIIQGQYDINSVWKVPELALKCTDNGAAKRPTMSMVVMELNESLDLEIATEGDRVKSKTDYKPNNSLRNENFASNASQNSALEMAYMVGMTGPAGPEAR